jgi:hypothetical protein
MLLVDGSLLLVLITHSSDFQPTTPNLQPSFLGGEYPPGHHASTDNPQMNNLLHNLPLIIILVLCIA